MPANQIEVLFQMERRQIGMGIFLRKTGMGFLIVRATSLADERFPDGPTMCLRPSEVVRARTIINPKKIMIPAQEILSVLEKMDMTRRDLAREAKVSLATIDNALANEGISSYRTQVAIEFALGQPFWSSPESYQRCKEVKELIGFLPQVESFKRLKSRARQLGVKRYGTATSKPDLTALILRELAERQKRMEKLQAAMAEEI